VLWQKDSVCWRLAVIIYELLLIYSANNICMKYSSPENNIKKNERKDKQEKTDKLLGRSLKISSIEDGDAIPVGGGILSNEVDTMMVCDFGELAEFYEKVDGGVEQLTDKTRQEKLKQWLKENDTNIDPELFAQLTAFNQVYKHEFVQNASEVKIQRKDLYVNDNEKEATLSEVLHKSSPKCAEIVALAQYFLQQEGVSSSYIVGDILCNKESDFSEDHSYLIIEDDGKEYIYDPSNPLPSESGPMPNVLRTEVDFEEEITKGEKCLVRAKNILIDNEVYYGVNDGTNIIPERDFVE